jgi:N-acetylglucosaminyl-diphospho-decaprenol L-rhamnosyltransferase
MVVAFRSRPVLIRREEEHSSTGRFIDPSKTIMKLSIIFVNWNSVDYLTECIASIYRYEPQIPIEIIVVDNASPRDRVESLSEKFPEVVLIKSKKNLGFAAANNLGFKHSTGSYVLFLNPDTKLTSPAITTMLEGIKSLPLAGIVGCKLLNTDLSVQLTSIQKFPTILNQLFDLEFLQIRWPSCPLWDISPLFLRDPVPTPVEVISGACMLFRREVFAKVGMFSEDYFMYAEDIDLNYKVRSAGFQNYYLGQASIVHHGGGSSSRQSVSQWKTIMKYNAMLKYYRKNRGRTYEALYRTTMGCSAAGRLLLLALTYPLSTIFSQRQFVRQAISKWTAILKWAVGRQALSAEIR